MRVIVSKLQIGVLALAVACTASAVPRYIGMVSAEGSFWVDSTGVSDHATVFEGSMETTDAPATVQMEARCAWCWTLTRGRRSMQTTSYWREAVANLTAALIIGWRRARCARHARLGRGPWWRSAIPAPSMLDPSKEICALLMRMECASPMSGPPTRSSFAWSW